LATITSQGAILVTSPATDPRTAGPALDSMSEVVESTDVLTAELRTAAAAQHDLAQPDSVVGAPT
jgi:hypothetical protein